MINSQQVNIISNKKSPKKFRQDSKLAQARSIYLKLKHSHTRKEIIITFMEELGFFVFATANTYYQLVKDSDGAKKTKSKIETARAIMDRDYNKKTRSEIINLFKNELGLTKEVSNSYYDRIRKTLL